MPPLPRIRKGKASLSRLFPQACNQVFVSGADELVAYLPAFRNGPDIKMLFDFIRLARYVPPAVALLLYLQNPGIIIVQGAIPWERRFARRVRPGSRIYVLPGSDGEPDFVFDVTDTEPINPADDRVPPRVHGPAPAKAEPPPDMLSRLTYYCSYNRIQIVWKSSVESQMGQISRVDDLRWDFQVTIDPEISTAQKIAVIALELARIFCGHLGLVDDGCWIEHGTPSSRTRVFEAEAVAYLVTERLLLDLGAVNYFSDFLEGGEAIPEYSLDAVLRAAGKIQNIFRGVHPRDTILKVKCVDHA